MTIVAGVAWGDGPSPDSIELNTAPSVWYDPSRGVVPVEIDDPRGDNVNRHSRWVPRKNRAKPQRTRSLNQNTAGGGGGGGGSGWFGSLNLGSGLRWLFLILMVSAVLAAAVWVATRFQTDDAPAGPGRSKRREDDGPSYDIERIEELPEALVRISDDPREAARQWRERGEFDRAVECLFAHQLLLLDHAGRLRLSRGKTNRRYVRECRSNDASAGATLEATTAAFDRSYFGNRPPTGEQFDALWDSNVALETSLTAGVVAAA